MGGGETGSKLNCGFQVFTNSEESDDEQSDWRMWPLRTNKLPKKEARPDCGWTMSTMLRQSEIIVL